MSTLSVVKTALRGVAQKVGPHRDDLPLASWHLSRDGEGLLRLGGLELESLLARFGSPLHVVDAERIAENVARFRHDGCATFYSYKTNPVPGVLRLLHDAGAGAEVVSEYELWLAFELGVAPENIVYNGPSKPAAALEMAIRREVGLINLNDRSEIETAVRAARSAGTRAMVGMRVAPPGTVGGQFGERTDDGSALAAFDDALSRPELRVRALHAHPNHPLATLAQLDAFLDPVLAFTDTLRERIGLDLDILDFGGNLACPTIGSLSSSMQRLAVTFARDPIPRMPDLPIEKYVERVASRVRVHYGMRKMPAPQIRFEPGRALTGNAQMLLCRVTSIQDRNDGLVWAVLDAGINVAEPVKSELHQLFVLRDRGAPKRSYRLTGPSCTLADQLYPAWTLPELCTGDGLAIMDSGAYFVPFATCFSRPRPAIAIVSNGRAELVRRAETFDDLVRADQGWRP